MEVAIRYRNPRIAQEFGCYSLKEVVVLPDTAVYNDILNLLKEKYKVIHVGKIDDKILETSFNDEFVIFCDKGIISQIKDELIKVKEVTVSTLIAGG